MISQQSIGCQIFFDIFLTQIEYFFRVDFFVKSLCQRGILPRFLLSRRRKQTIEKPQEQQHWHTHDTLNDYEDSGTHLYIIRNGLPFNWHTAATLASTIAYKVYLYINKEFSPTTTDNKKCTFNKIQNSRNELPTTNRCDTIRYATATPTQNNETNDIFIYQITATHHLHNTATQTAQPIM